MYGDRRIFASKVILLIIGIAWCIAIFRRRHEDVEALRVSDDDVEKGVILGFWIVTAVIAVAVVRYGTLLLDDVIDF